MDLALITYKGWYTIKQQNKQTPALAYIFWGEFKWKQLS